MPARKKPKTKPPGNKTGKKPVKSSGKVTSKVKLKSAARYKNLQIIVVSSLLLFLTFFALYLLHLDRQIVEKMSGRIWSLPSYIYARPLEIYPGKSITYKDIVSELKALGYSKTEDYPQQSGQFREVGINQLELMSKPFNFWDGLQESRSISISINNSKVSSIKPLYSEKTLSLFRFEPQKIAGIYPQQKEDRQIIKLSQVPDDLVLSLLSVEDRRFYQHSGIDFRSIARAVVANTLAGKTVQGGSTLTQQLVKNMFLTPERTLLRKINEALMSIILEFRYDKSNILEAYLNEVYLGQSGSRQIHGFELASQFYFARSLTSLSRDQMALLVGIVKGPSWYEPRRHPQRALARRNQVLEIMYQQGALSLNQFQKYKAKPLGLSKKPSTSGNRYPALVDLVKRQLKQDYNENDLKTSGLRIFTSIDPLKQDAAEKSVEKILPGLERNADVDKPLQVSLIIASSQQGEIEAMVSDRNPRFPGFNRSLDASRQIGSLIKPAVYLSALKNAEQFNLLTPLDDSAIHIKNETQQIWSPQNYDQQFKGKMSLYSALRDSRNIPAVRLGLNVGLANIAETIQQLGIKRDIPAYPSVTLGAFNLTPLEVANMYQTFAANGFHTPLKVIREVLRSDGKPLKRYPLETQQSVDEKAIFLINWVLNQVTHQGTARYLNNQFDIQLAGKTGTTDDLRDSWFAGFSDNQLVVTWIGRDDNTSTGLTGSTGALRLWSHVMQQLPNQGLSLNPPVGVEMHWIDEQSGGLYEQSCRGAVELPFISGSAPIEKVECKSGFFYQLKRLFN